MQLHMKDHLLLLLVCFLLLHLLARIGWKLLPGLVQQLTAVVVLVLHALGQTPLGGSRHPAGPVVQELLALPRRLQVCTDILDDPYDMPICEPVLVCCLHRSGVAECQAQTRRLLSPGAVCPTQANLFWVLCLVLGSQRPEAWSASFLGVAACVCIPLATTTRSAEQCRLCRCFLAELAVLRLGRLAVSQSNRFLRGERVLRQRAEAYHRCEDQA